MYDELVKRLRNRRICIQQLGTLNDYPLLGEAANAIEELQEKLITTETDLSDFKEAMAWKEHFGDKPCWSYSGIGEITHWCEQIPLPEPPKEE